MGRSVDATQGSREELPTGTVTLLFTDIESSTRLLQQFPAEYGELLAEYRRLLRGVFARNRGVEIETEGDSFFVAFRTARDAIAAAAEAQRALVGGRWPHGAEVRVRMGLLTGEPTRTEAGYVGLDVHRAARIASAAHGRQVLLSASVRALVEGEEPLGVALRDLGEHQLKDIARPERLFQLVVDGLPDAFPALRTEPSRIPTPDAGEPWDSGVVGRAEELESLAQFVELVPKGPAALLLEGPAGIGKTTLWRAARRLARERSYRLLSCAPSAAEAQLPFTALGDLLHDVLDETLGRLPPPQRRALQVALLLAEPSGPPPDQRAVSVGVLGALRVLAGHRPVVLAIDDAQWLDPASARVLEFTFRRLERLPLGIVAVCRVGEHVPLGFDREFAEQRLQRLAIGPLALDALDRMLRAHLGTSFLRPTLLQLEETCGGNPFFALEIGRALLRRDRPLEPGEPLPVPTTIRDLIGERLAGLPGPTRETLQIAAALSEPTVSLVEAAAPGAESALAAAVDAGVLEISDDRVRFAHPLLASAVYADMSPRSQHELHRRLAEVVADADERARHLAAATETPDADVAAALEEAARRAHARAAPQAAAGFAEQARRLTPRESNEDLARRSIDAAEYTFQAGDLHRARALLEEVVAALQPGPLRARALHRLASLRAWEESFEAAEQTLAQALEEAGEDARLRVAVLGDLVLGLQQIGQLRRAHTHARTALSLAEALCEPAPLAGALTNLASTEFLLGNGVRADLMERAVALVDRAEREETYEHPSLFHPDLIWGVMLKWADEFEAARAKLEERRRRALERHEESSLPPLLFQLGELECWFGNWELAGRYAREGREAASQSGQQAMEMLSLYLGALIDAHAGRIEEGRAAAEEALALAERSSNHRFVIRCLAVLGFIELSVGDAAAAHRYLARAGELTAAAGYGEPGVVRFQADEIEALVALGRLEEAEALIEQLEERGRTLDRPWAFATSARCRGLLLAARGDLDGALIALEQAVDSHQRLLQPFEFGRTLLALGMVKRRARKKRLARESLQRALDTFERLGAPLWAEKARDELGRIGGRAPAPEALTPTEERVAELVASGATNREVAETLFMSVKTVERHLTHIFRKLDVSSRRDLARKRAFAARLE